MYRKCTGNDFQFQNTTQLLQNKNQDSPKLDCQLFNFEPMTAGIPFFIDALAGRGRRGKHLQEKGNSTQDILVERSDTNDSVASVPSFSPIGTEERMVIESLKPKPNKAKEFYGNSVCEHDTFICPKDAIYRIIG
jgi:hypothetical protein